MRPTNAIIISVGVIAGALIMRPVNQHRAQQHLHQAQPQAEAVAPMPTLPQIIETSFAMNDSQALIPDVSVTVITPELAQECIEVADAIDPDLAKQLGDLWEADPSAFQQMIRDHHNRLLGLVELRKLDESLFDLVTVELKNASETEAVVVALRQAMADGDEEARERLENKLLMQIRMMLGFRLHWQEQAVCRLEEDVTRIRTMFEEDHASFENRVQHELKCLVGE